jgi:hypothetical protein
MLQSIARQLTVLHLPVAHADRVFALGAVGSFVWLLLNDKVHPLAVYLLQAYLSF